MLDLVDVGESSLASYVGIAPDDLLDTVARTAEALRGARVLHVNATPYGGGVSELLRSVVPLLNDLGLSADWRIISGDEPFFQVTKAIHNGLQGAAVSLSDADKARYLATSRTNAAGFDLDYDFIFIHDPQRRRSVCGMAVEAGKETTTLDGLTLRFCSSRCREAFARAPDRYLGAAGARPTGAGAAAG